MVGVFLVGLYLISRNLAKSLSSISASSEASSGSSAPAAISPQVASSASTTTGFNKKDRGAGFGGEVSFNDSLKLSDKIKEIVEELEKDKNFPTFEDILDFDQLAVNSTKTLSSILEEMPEDMRIKLFEISNSPKWFDAIIDHGDLNIDAYYFLHLIVRKK